MKRKTNLFYRTGIDSTFLTFSNYTEAITGTMLSTNTKLFPSNFLCLKIENLSDLKTDIINDLVSRYENKLAFLRDNLKNVEQLNPLLYLFETLSEYLPSDGDSKIISHMGTITEQDFNGKFADSICVIDTNNLIPYKFFYNQNTELNSIEYDSDINVLYGWEIDELPDSYKTLTPVFDGENNNYNVLSDISSERINDNIPTEITFNVIIPLFNMVNSDDEQSVIISEGDNNTINSSNNENVPLGIWFSNRDITLYNDTNYGQVWSLTIGSQFKPFPTSDYITSEITNESNKAAFGTFSCMLAKQSKILDQFNRLSLQIAEMQKRLSDIELQLNNKN